MGSQIHIFNQSLGKFMVFCIIVLKPRDIWKYVRVVGVVVYVKDIRDDVLELCAEPVGSWRGCVILPTHY